MYVKLHHVRPEISSFLVGRTKELEKLGEILRANGSAVITQYGGTGKSELIVALPARAENGNVLAGRVHWVTVDGEVTNVCRDLSIWDRRAQYRTVRRDSCFTAM